MRAVKLPVIATRFTTVQCASSNMARRSVLFLSALVLATSCVAGTQTGNGSSPDVNIIGEDAVTYDPDLDLTTPNIIRRHGYPAESHVALTEDGYLLTLHRIPAKSRPVVFLQHGLLASSTDWITAGPGKALAYLLWERGYDVWMGNARGNSYSRSHATLDTADPKFWDFSFHEMGVYDLPAAIDHVLNVTEQRELVYLGHSMGTTIFYIMASLRADIGAKVKAMFSLAPVAYVAHLKSPIRLLAPWSHDVEFLARFFGANEFLPQSKILKLLSKYGCELDVTEERICENAIFALCGYDAQQFNETLLPMILSHTPAGTSTKTIIHFAQEVKSGKFQQYDHGTKQNMVVYGQATPPEYNLAQINVPVSLHVASNDWLASLTDVDDLVRQLQHMIGKFVVPLPSFNHLDFLWGKDVKTLVYDKVLKIMKTFKISQPTTQI